MRGGQVFMDSLLIHGANRIFGNPGTTENSMLDRLIDYPDIEYYVALHEGVAVGAASFYALASETTGIANLHVAPGLGNGIGMMFNALKANAPIIVTAGQQDTRMRLQAPLLSHDLVAMAEPVTKWSVEPQSADEMAPIMQRAFKIANDHPRGPVFVSLPVNVMEQETTVAAVTSGTLERAGVPNADNLLQLATLLHAATSPAILVGDDVAGDGAVAQTVALAEKIGAAVFHEGLRCQISFPNQHPNHRGGIPFEAAHTHKMLARYDLVLMLGGHFFEDIWFDSQSPIPDSTRLIQINSSQVQLAAKFRVDLGLVGNLRTTLEQILERLNEAPGDDFEQAAAQRNSALNQEHQAIQADHASRLERLWDTSPMSPGRAIREISQALPEDTIVVDESITASLETATHFDFQQPGDYFAGRGGGIGQGIAAAIGVQVAQPGRRVLALSGDGSAMYSIQALWTAAHHGLPIVFVILANREYRVLKHNMDIYRARFGVGSNKPYPNMDLNTPELDFPALAQGMGVAAERISDADALAGAIENAFATNAPYLIEVVISGKQ